MDKQSIEAQLKRQGGIIKDLSPFTKLLMVVCMAVLSIIFGSPVYIAIISVVYIILAVAAHTFYVFFKSYIKIFIFFGLMLILMSALFQSSNSEVLCTIGKISLYEAGFFRGCKMSSIILSIAGGLLFFTTSTPIQDLMAVLSKKGLSSNVVYVVVATFQSITELSGKMKQILDAQSSRGIETEGNIIVRLKAILPMLITLLLSSMVSAEEKAIALEARCFNCPGEKTALRVYKSNNADAVCITIMLVITVGIIGAKFIFQM